MVRECLIIKRSSEYSSIYNRAIGVDVETQEEIFAALCNKDKKFRDIVRRILTQPNIYYDHYKKEKINERSRNISAMRFLDGDNTRIYCKEINDPTGTLIVICAVALNKKVQRNDKKINAIIEKIVSYEYKIVEAY